MNAETREHLRAEKFAEVFTDTKSYHSLQELSIEELRALNKMVVATINNKKQNEGFGIKLSLSVGDIVEVNDKDFINECLEVLKLNPKKAKLKRENGEVWNIPYSMIKN